MLANLTIAPLTVVLLEMHAKRARAKRARARRGRGLIGDIRDALESSLVKPMVWAPLCAVAVVLLGVPVPKEIDDMLLADRIDHVGRGAVCGRSGHRRLPDPVHVRRSSAT